MYRGGVTENATSGGPRRPVVTVFVVGGGFVRFVERLVGERRDRAFYRYFELSGDPNDRPVRAVYQYLSQAGRRDRDDHRRTSLWACREHPDYTVLAEHA